MSVRVRPPAPNPYSFLRRTAHIKLRAGLVLLAAQKEKTNRLRPKGLETSWLVYDESERGGGEVDHRVTVWVGIIGTLLGAVVGGALALLNARVQFRQQVNRDRQKFLLVKMEELHEVLSRTRRAHHASLYERISTHAGAELPGAIMESMEVPVERLELLTKFYAPELTTDLDKIDRLRLKFGEAIQKSMFLAGNLSAVAKRNDIDALDSEWKPLDYACRDMQTRVVEVSRKYL